MTIAVGFVNDHGVLLCSDTLVSNEVVTTYRSKIVPIVFNDGRALIAFSGLETFADSAIEKIRDALQRYNGRPRPLSAIAEQIRRTWFSAFRPSHKGFEWAADQIIAAVWCAKDHDVALYRSSNESFAESDGNFEAIGVGDMLARYLIGSWSCDRTTPERRTFERAIRALGLIKAFLPASVGGNLIAVNLDRDGCVALYGENDIEAIEEDAIECDDVCRKVATSFLNIVDENKFTHRLKFLSVWLRTAREQRKKLLAVIHDWDDSGSPPDETGKIRQAFTSIGLRYPQHPKVDPSPPQPSPEKPGGSDESE